MRLTGSVNYRIHESWNYKKICATIKLCDPSQLIDFGSHLGYIGTYHVIRDLLMPSTYAAVTALLKDTDAFKYDRL